MSNINERALDRLHQICPELRHSDELLDMLRSSRTLNELNSTIREHYLPFDGTQILLPLIQELGRDQHTNVVDFHTVRAYLFEDDFDEAIDPEIALDPDVQAFMRMEKKGQFKNLAPGTWVAIFDGEVIATAATYKELSEQEVMQEPEGGTFARQVNKKTSNGK